MEGSPPSDSEAMRSPQAKGRGLRRSRLTRRERRRLALALLLSLLLHTLLLSLNFGGQEFGFPGFGFRWQDRRVEVRELRVVLDPPRVEVAEPAAKSVAKPVRSAPIKPRFAGAPADKPSVSTKRPRRPPADKIAPKADRTAKAMPKQGFATGPAAKKAPSRANASSDAAPAPIPERTVIAVERSDETALVVPPSRSEPSPVFAAALGASSPEQLEPQVEAARQEAARVEAMRLEVERKEAAQQAAARLEVARQDAARQEAARVDATRVDATRVEAMRLEGERLEEAERQEAVQQVARRAVAQQEAARQEVARVEATRLEAEQQEATQAAARREVAQQQAARQEAALGEVTRLEGERQEAAQQAAARREGAQQEAARRDAARVEATRLAAERQEAMRSQSAKEEAERREAVLRAIGRQLDAEAAQRAAAASAARQPDKRPYSLSTARRGRLWGRADPNTELVLYAEAWARKIQFNTPFDVVRKLAKHPHIDPLVTVAIRSDGSVESVTIVLSSGSTEIDEAIRRIVRSHEHYQAFPPGLAREFDVIEIRRTWYFDAAVRLE